MKAITLHQTWASLIAEGVKTIETRNWPPPLHHMKQLIAIHAGKRSPKFRELPNDISWVWTEGQHLGEVVALARPQYVHHVKQITWGPPWPIGEYPATAHFESGPAQECPQ